MTRAEEFEQLRPLLFAIAYRILGSVSEAEDAVQEAWLRYEASPTPPTSAKAFLSAVVTRISIDVLRSARLRREEYVGPWFPEPLLTDPYEDPERSAELADSVSTAALLLERLSPLERAVFVLQEVFGFSFPEVASAVGRSEAACRQGHLRRRERGPGARRARGAVRADRRRPGAAPGERPAGRDLPRPGRQGHQHVGARHPRRADPDHPHGGQPRQARAPGSGSGRLGGHPRATRARRPTD
jgi:RNA polymerase sigma-70 factor, ECF subfamily